MNVFLLALMLLFAQPVQAASLPDLGDASQAGLSPADEARLGSEIMQQIRQQPDYYDDPELTDYLESIGYRLVANCDENEQTFHFFAIRDRTLNAFSLPGGYVAVHTGLIEATQNESELAGVLGHEISHVTQHHMARMLEQQHKELLPSIGMLALSILAARSNPNVAGGALAASQGAMLQNQLDFSRNNEREADRLGIETMSRAGFDPRGMVSFFQRLQHYDRLDENSSQAYLRTHPLTSERIADMQNRVAQMPARTVSNSLEYDLLRVRLRVLALPPAAAIAVQHREIDNHLYSGLLAEHYGLALALLRDRRFSQAENEYLALAQYHQHSPILDMLGADIRQSAGDFAGALARYQTAWQHYPNYRPLAYRYSEALLNQGQPQAALSIIDAALEQYPHDHALHQLQSRCYAAQNRDFLRHYAQARALHELGQTDQAIEQLQLALKTRDGDFYQMSSAEALLERWKDEKKKAASGHDTH